MAIGNDAAEVMSSGRHHARVGSAGVKSGLGVVAKLTAAMYVAFLRP